MHSKRNDYQNEKATCGKGEDTNKSYIWYGVDSQNIWGTHTTWWQTRNPILKWAKNLNRHFFQRKLTSGYQFHEEMLNNTNHKKDANQNHRITSKLLEWLLSEREKEREQGLARMWVKENSVRYWWEGKLGLASSSSGSVQLSLRWTCGQAYFLSFLLWCCIPLYLGLFEGRTSKTKFWRLSPSPFISDKTEALKCKAQEYSQCWSSAYLSASHFFLIFFLMLIIILSAIFAFKDAF